VPNSKLSRTHPANHTEDRSFHARSADRKLEKIARLEVVNREADLRFRALALTQGLNPDDRWIGGSVDHAWERNGPVFEHFGVPVSDARVLEFGCFVGGTAIVLAALGATVTAVDVDPAIIELATANAERHGARNVRFHCVTDTTRLPFRDGEFDVAVCYSVLEYLPPAVFHRVQKEIDRTVRGGGVIFVAGTSNRLWPRETHSRRWFTNYVPRVFDGVLFRSQPPERGLWPWEILRGFERCENLDLADRGHAFLSARRARGMARAKYLTLKLSIPMLRAFGVWAGLLTPCISVTLKKR
jgi:2-polyprenyl-3-methyl-5-hydroxy-6-metoxy-1,4-benzoquinol methylase